MPVRFYGAGPYTRIRGFALNGFLLYYKSPEEDRREAEAASQAFEKKCAAEKAEAAALKSLAGQYEQAVDCKAAIAAWKDGRPVHVVEMGGMGLPYERDIHEIAFAILEVMLDVPPPDGSKEYRNKIEEDPRLKKTFDEVYPSGAMKGAAYNEAFVFFHKGYREGLASAPQDRIIVLTRN